MIWDLVEKNKKIIKFLISSSIVAMVEFNLLYFLTEVADWWYLLSAGFSFSAAFVVSFTFQKFWTFRDYCREQIYRQLSLYLSLGLINLFLNQSILYLAVEYLGFWYFGAQMVIAAILGLASFLFYKIFVFRKLAKECPDKQHILIATGIFPPDLGGPATFASSLAEALSRAGYGVRVVAFADGEGQSSGTYELVKVSRKHCKFWRYLLYFLKLWNYSNRSDVLYAMDMISVGLPSAVVKFLDRRLRFVVRLGGDHQWESGVSSGEIDQPMETYYSNGHFSSRAKWISFANSLVLSQADKVVFNCRYLRDVLSPYKNIPERKREVICNISPECPLGYSIAANKSFAKKKLLFAGRLSRVKNLTRLIQAFKVLKKRYNEEDVKLVIVGEGPESVVVAEEARKLEIQDSVVLMGKMDRQRLFLQIASSSLIVLPSLTEFNSNLVSEALSLNKKVLLSRYSEHYYLSDDRENLFYVDPLSVDDIARVMKEALLAAEPLSSAVALSGEAWNVDQVVSEHIRVFFKNNT